MTWCDDVDSYKHVIAKAWKKTCDSHLCNTSNETQHTPNKVVASNNDDIWLVDHDHNRVELNGYSPMELIYELFMYERWW